MGEIVLGGVAIALSVAAVGVAAGTLLRLRKDGRSPGMKRTRLNLGGAICAGLVVPLFYARSLMPPSAFLTALGGLTLAALALLWAGDRLSR
jgi:hypothetical protein